jgi:NCS2 family nucleobase:cation symporter-2
MGMSSLALAVGAILQALRRGPVGSGYMAPPVISATFMGPSVVAAGVGGMRLVYGMTIIAGLFESLIAIVLRRLRLVITPVVSGLTVFIVGLQLGIVGVSELLDVEHEALPAFPVHLMVAFSTLAICMALSIWGRGVVKLLCSTVGLGFGMVAGSFAGMLDPHQLGTFVKSSWFEVPRPAFDYGFDLGLLPAFLAAGTAAGFRAVGVVTTCQRINNAGWRHPDISNIRKGVLADGLANVAGGLLGTAGMSIGPSIVGISSATGATSRFISYAAAGYLVILGFSPKLAGIFLLIPPEVAGSILMFSASFLITGGLQLILSRPIDSRATYVIGISTLLALSENLFPDYFRHLPPVLHSLAAGPLALGLTAALVLTLVFRLGTRQRNSFAWGTGKTGVADLVPFLRRALEGWKVPPEISQRASNDMDAIAGFLRQHAMLSGAMELSYNGIEVQTAVTYDGAHEAPLHRSLWVPKPVESLDQFENEEEAAFVGLRDFLKSMTADRKFVSRRRGRLTLTLRYDAQ